MQIELEEMSREELHALRKDVDKALSSVDDRRRAEARAAAEKAVRDYGYNLDDIAMEPAKNQKSPPKYRNPDDPRKTWTGRGRQPEWIKQGLNEGKTLEEFAI